jgi:hypothetical protein
MEELIEGKPILSSSEIASFWGDYEDMVLQYMF